MNKQIEELANCVGKDVLVRVGREPIDKHVLDGFVVGISDKLLLLHVINDNTCTLNGYSAVQRSDLRSYQICDSFLSPALRLLERKPVIPDDIDLSNWTELIASLQRKGILVWIEVEKKAPGCGFVGRVVRQTKQFVVLETVDMQGEWAEIEQIAFKDITKVEFAGGYVEALAQLITHRDGVLDK